MRLFRLGLPEDHVLDSNLVEARAYRALSQSQSPSCLRDHSPRDHAKSSLMTQTMGAPQPRLVQTPHFTVGEMRGRSKGSNLSKFPHGAVADLLLELTHSFCQSFLLVPDSVQGAEDSEVTKRDKALPRGSVL